MTAFVCSGRIHMRSFTITNNRTFMAALFTGTLFDSFQTESVQITTACTLKIDGRTVPAFYTAEELAEMHGELPAFTLWANLRNLCFSAIKGKKTPLSFQITFHAGQETADRLTALEECTVDRSFVQALVLTVRFESGVCRLTTGTAYTTFLPDKSLDPLWDAEMQRFLSEHEIETAVM